MKTAIILKFKLFLLFMTFTFYAASQLSDIEYYKSEGIVISGAQQILSADFVAYGGKNLYLIRLRQNSYEIINQISVKENINNISYDNNRIFCLSNKGNLFHCDIINENIINDENLNGKLRYIYSNIEFVKCIEDLLFIAYQDNSSSIKANYKIDIFNLNSKITKISSISATSFWKILDIVKRESNFYFIYYNGNIKYANQTELAGDLLLKDLPIMKFDEPLECYLEQVNYDGNIIYLYCSNMTNISVLNKYKFLNDSQLINLDKIDLGLHESVELITNDMNLIVSYRNDSFERIKLIESEQENFLIQKEKIYKKYRFGDILKWKDGFVIFGYNNIYKLTHDLEIHKVNNIDSINEKQ